MDDRDLLEALVRAAEQLGVRVRVEPFEDPAAGAGGSCLLRGERLLLLNAAAPVAERLAVVARALAELGCERVFLVPEAREAVERARRTRP